MGILNYLVLPFKVVGYIIYGLVMFVKYLVVRIFVRREYLTVEQCNHLNFDYKRRRNMICSLLFMDGTMTKARLEKVIYEKLRHHSVWTKRIVCGNFIFPYFVKAEGFKISDNIFESKLKTGTFEEMQEFISEIASTPFDFSVPCWHFHVIQNVIREGKKMSVVLLKYHHAFMDGFASIRWFFLISEKKDVNAKDDWVLKSKKKKRRSRRISIWKRFKMFWVGMYKVVLLPKDNGKGYFRNHKLLKSHEKTYFAMNEKPIQLDVVKKTAAHFKVSVNDVMMCCVSKGIRKFLQKYGTEFDKKVLLKRKPQRSNSAMCWVSMGPQSFPAMLRTCCQKRFYPMSNKEYGCKIGCVIFSFFPHIKDDKERMQAHHEQLADLILSPEPLLTQGVIKLFGSLPPPIIYPIFNALAHKCSFSISNIPGPTTVRTLAGMDVDSVIFGTNPLGTISEMCHFMSYKGKVLFSVLGRKKYSEMKEFVAMVVESFDEIFALVPKKEKDQEKVEVKTETATLVTEDLKEGKTAATKSTDLTQGKKEVKTEPVTTFV